jgi:hypothetical protein
VPSREVYNIIKPAAAGHSGNPADYRDFVLPAPPSSWAGGASARAAAR